MTPTVVQPVGEPVPMFEITAAPVRPVAEENG